MIDREATATRLGVTPRADDPSIKGDYHTLDRVVRTCDSCGAEYGPSEGRRIFRPLSPVRFTAAETFAVNATRRA